MGFLDGDLQPVVTGAFGWLLLDGSLHTKRVMIDNRGNASSDPPDAGSPIKGMIDKATQQMREADGFQETDVALLWLAEGVPDATLDHQITLRGQTFHVLPPLALDAAMTHWTARGRAMAGEQQ